MGVLPVVLTHDERAARITSALNLDRGVISSAADFTPDLLEPYLVDIGADDRVVVVHVSGRAPADEKAFVEELVRCRVRLRAVIPGARNLRQWLLQLAGPTWDVDERRTALAVRASAVETGLGGVLVVAQSSVASLRHTEAEELVSGRDVLRCLLHSPELERLLADTPGLLLTGTASVALRAEGPAAAGRAEVDAVLHALLAQHDGMDASLGMGANHGAGLRLDDDGERLRLERSAEGGSLLAPLRASALLEVGALTRAPVGDWPLLVGTAIEELDGLRVPAALARIEALVTERRSELVDELDRAVLAHFRDHRSIAAAESFAEGLARSLDTARAAVLAARPQTAPLDVTAAADRLRRYAEHLPSAAAVTVRALLLAVLLVLLVTGPVTRYLLLSDEDARLTARGAAVLSALLAVLFLRSRWRRLVRARDAVLRAAAHAAELRVSRGIDDARVDLVAHLVRHLRSGPDSWLARLAQLRQDCQTAVSPEAATRGAGPASRFAASLPLESWSAAPNPVVRDQRIEQAADRLAQCGLRPPQPDLRGWLAAGMEAPGGGEATLRDHLLSSTSALEEARRVLSLDVVPVVGEGYAELQEGALRRYLCSPGGRDGSLARLIIDSADEWRLPLLDVLDHDDPRFTAVFHARDAGLPVDLPTAMTS